MIYVFIKTRLQT